MNNNNLLEIKDLHTDFMTVRGIVYAVQGVNIEVKKGEIHGIVGESGCGKSVTAKSIMRLHDEEHSRYSGEILYNGENGEINILNANKKQLSHFRGNDAAMIFQDPMTSLDPIMRAGEQISEMLRMKKQINRKDAKKEVLSLFEKIGITPSEKRYEQYPFEMSGGMLQRIMIAMALSCKPKLLIDDELVSALDVSVQANILNLMLDLKRDYGQTILFISHDLNVVKHICDKLAVVYLGSIMEMGSVEQIISDIKHPYTEALVSAKPKEHPLDKKEHILLDGDIPNAIDVPEGCRFAGRCRYFKDGLCSHRTPKLKDIGGGHFVACHFPIKRSNNNRKDEKL